MPFDVAPDVLLACPKCGWGPMDVTTYLEKYKKVLGDKAFGPPSICPECGNPLREYVST